MLRKRPLFVFLSSVIFSYVAAFFLKSNLMVILAGILLLSATVCAFFRKIRRVALLILLPSALAFACFFLFYHFAYQPMEKLQGQEVEVHGEVVSGVSSGITSDSITVRPSDIIIDKKSYKSYGDILVYAEKGTMNYSVGSKVKFVGKTFKNETDGFSIDYRLTQRQFLSMYATEGNATALANQNSIHVLISKAQQKIIAIYNSVFSKDTAALIGGITLGQTEEIDAQTYRNFKDSGVSHTMAVSGMHLAFVTTVLYFALALVSKNLYLRAVLQIILIWLFTALTGFSPSCSRAAIMLTIFQIGILLHKESDPLTALSFAVMMCCITNPFAVLNPSLTLSATATLGILLLTNKISALFPNLKKPHSLLGKTYSFIRNTISMSVAATIGTLPVMLTMFQSVSLLAPVTNVLIVMVVEVLFFIGFLSIIFSWLRPVCICLSFVADILYKYCDAVTSVIAKLPFCNFFTGSRGFWIIFLLLCIVFIALWIILRKKHPYRLAMCYLAVFLCLIGSSYIVDFAQRNTIWVDYVNVGQGNTAVISRNHTAMLVDCGGTGLGYQEIQKCFAKRGVRDISSIYVTHLDLDHIKYLEPLLSAYSVDDLFVPYRKRYEKDDSYIFTLADTRSTQVHKISKDMIYQQDGLEVKIFTKHVDLSESSENQKSLVYRLRYGPTELLFPGDIEFGAEQRLTRIYKEQIESDVLMVPHHGSGNASNEEFLEYVDAELAVISVEKNNYYKLPNAMALKRIDRKIPILRRTDLDGTVSIKLTENQYKIEGMK